MRSNISLLIFLLIIIFAISCDRLTDNPGNTGSLNYLSTELGGCNNQDFDLKNEIQASGNDTIYWMESGDTLEFFIGINYICCTPFTTDHYFGHDTITMYLKDTCSAPDECYCRCMCYYTFRFQFEQHNIRNIYYKAMLTSSLTESPKQLFEGAVKE